MHNKSLIFSFLLALGSFSFLQAQYLEAGFGVGASLYEGDLSPDSPLKRFQLLRPAGSAFVKWHLNPKFDWALNVNYLQLYGDDKKSDNAGRKERNLDFTSNVFEFNTTLEWNILGFEPERLYSPFSPYIFARAGIFHHNPKTKYQDTWYELQPLGTEGQGLSQYPEREYYKLWQPNLLLGIGIKWALTERLNLSSDFGVRLVFTDYLDDASSSYIASPEIAEVHGPIAAALSNRIGEGRGTGPVILPSGSLRASPNSTDYYLVGFVKLSWNLYNVEPLAGRKNQMGCPRF